jgi:V/A-type H+-transporting ATPase subunit E
MEVKIDQLIEKLKKEGVEGAQKSADEVLANARKEADDIVANAKKKADQLVADAGKKAETFEGNSKLAIQQAARDGELLLKGRITALFDRVFKQSVAETMDAAFLKELIVKIAARSGEGDLEVELSAADLKALESTLLSGMKREIKQGIDLKASNDLAGGFHIGLKGNDVYYDFSDESIAEILKKALNPRLKEILESSNG